MAAFEVKVALEAIHGLATVNAIGLASQTLGSMMPARAC
jgi:hypothetical protein